ncbi:MAG: hypothetical protein ACHP9Y_06415, partial [Gammaproteobacteria bacterium]
MTGNVKRTTYGTYTSLPQANAPAPSLMQVQAQTTLLQSMEHTARRLMKQIILALRKSSEANNIALFEQTEAPVETKPKSPEVHSIELSDLGQIFQDRQDSLS